MSFMKMPHPSAARRLFLGQSGLALSGAAVALLIGGPIGLYTLLFGVFCIIVEVALSYERYASVLKWATLSLFAYVAVVVVAQVPWGEALTSLVVPRIEWTGAYATAVVAILGTTISPYLFFWQASQEVEEQRAAPGERPLIRAPKQARAQLRVHCHLFDQLNLAESWQTFQEL